ncbi:uncharacterized protein LOC123261259 [Cotesia glomerata]|uniref:uncharacterized protein LOC123261259 n=1 Tax=Cotesia glomerata TaxID=32391 RepID=UPI001D017688|nr:uncharacterized protein LOC123261259 [Cotesia glomerata]
MDPIRRFRLLELRFLSGIICIKKWRKADTRKRFHLHCLGSANSELGRHRPAVSSCNHRRQAETMETKAISTAQLRYKSELPSSITRVENWTRIQKDPNGSPFAIRLLHCLSIHSKEQSTRIRVTSVIRQNLRLMNPFQNLINFLNSRCQVWLQLKEITLFLCSI